MGATAEERLLDHLRDAFDELEAAVSLVDSQGRVLRTDRQTCALLGSTVDELTGAALDDLVADDDRAALADALSAAVAQPGETSTTALRMRQGDAMTLRLTAVAGIHRDPLFVVAELYVGSSPASSASPPADLLLQPWDELSAIGASSGAISALAVLLTGLSVGDGCALWRTRKDGQLQVVSVYERDPEGHRLVSDIIRRHPTPSGPGYVARAVATGAPVVIADPFQGTPPPDPAYAEYLERHPVTALAFAPLHSAGELVGLLAVSRHGGPPFSPADVDLLTALGRVVAVACRQSDLLDRVWMIERRSRALIDHTPDILLLAAEDGRIIYGSPSSLRVRTGQGPARIGDAIHVEDVPLVADWWQRVAAAPGVHPPMQARMVDPERGLRWIEVVANNLLDDPAVRAVVVTVHDITDLRRWNEELDMRARQNAALAEIARAAAAGGVLPRLFRRVYDVIRETLGVPDAGVLQYLPDSDEHVVLAGRPSSAGARLRCGEHHGLTLVHRTGRPVVVPDYRETDVVDEPEAIEVWGVFSGVLAPVVVRGQTWGALTAHSVEPRHFTQPEVSFLEAAALTVASAIERDAVEQQIRHQALHDPLTALPNRLLLADRVEQALADAQRSGRAAALLLLDLDEFKDVNDSLGHAAGDAVLVQLAQRLRDVVRPYDTVARLGGDEFAVCVADIATEVEAVGLAQGIVEAARRPLQVDGLEVRLGASVGVAVAPSHGRTAEALLQHADVAMYRAKGGRLGTALYDATIDRARSERLGAVEALRRALDDEQLHLHYQPVVELATGRLVQVEALVRWRHPERGLILPAQFVPLAEDSGLIGDLTQHVVREALRQVRAWRDAGTPIRVAVNISPADLRSERHVDALVRAAEDSAGLLSIEVTESALVDAAGREGLRRLAAADVPCAVDDFGTGWSSLAYLRKLPVQRLKLDRTFTRDVDTEPRDASIVAAMTALARSLDMDVVAEGVETPSVARKLRELGVELAQGFLYGRPVPADQLAV